MTITREQNASPVWQDPRNEISVIQLSPAKAEPPDDDAPSRSNHKADAADFDSAITCAGFGRFNAFVIFTSCVCCISSMSQTTSMSLIFPRAQCDLNLSLADKGALNAAPYFGMILSAMMWGFLADVQGRRGILLYGSLATFCSDIFCGLSQSFWSLVVAKFCGGFISCGPFAVLMTYASEITPTKYRSHVVILLGASFSLSNILIPGLAWIVLPNDWDWRITDNFVIHSWNLFLLILAIPSLLCGVLFKFLPESPKFLMSRGKNEEALAVFQNIHRRNHPHSSNVFPIQSLADEKYVVSSERKSFKEQSHIIEVQLPRGNHRSTVNKSPTTTSLWTAIHDGLVQMMTIFEGPHLKNCIIVFCMQFGFLWSQNTMRLWLPSILGLISDYETTHTSSENDGVFDLCSVIEAATTISVSSLINNTTTEETVAVCSQAVTGDIYMNTILVGIVGICGYALTGVIIGVLSHRSLICINTLMAATIGALLYQSPTQLVLVALFSVYLTLGGITGSAMVGLTVTLVPTQLRTMTVSLLMMFGRIGSIFGNFLFPWLLALGCVPPFITNAAVVGLGGLLCLALPKSAQVPLK